MNDPFPLEASLSTSSDSDPTAILFKRPGTAEEEGCTEEEGAAACEVFALADIS